MEKKNSKLALYFSVLIVLTLVSLIHHTVIIGLYLFLIPGIILLCSSTLLLYSAIIVAIRLALPKESSKLFSIIITLGCISTFAFGIPAISSGNFNSIAGQYQNNDREAANSNPPTRIAVGYKSKYEDKYIYALECGILCATVLMTGEAKEVTVFDQNDAKNIADPAHPSGVRFRLEHRSSCPYDKVLTGSWRHFLSFGYPSESDRIKIILSRIANGECLIGEVVDKAETDTIVLLDQDFPLERDNSASVPFWNFFDPDIISVQRVSIGYPKDNNIEWETIRTEIKGKPLAPILHVGMPYRSDVGWGRIIKKIGEFEFGSFVEKKLGYSPITAVSSKAQREAIIRMMAENKKINDAENNAITQFVEQMTNAEFLNKEDIEVLRLLIANRQAKNILSFGRVAKYKEQLNPLADTIIDRLEDKNYRYNNQDYGFRSDLATFLSVMALDTLKPYTVDIGNLITDEPDLRGFKQLAARAGEFGPSMSKPIMKVLMRLGKDNIRWAAEGMCRIGPSASEYAPQLERLARSEIAAQDKYTAFFLITALTRMGKEEAVQDIREQLMQDSYFRHFLEPRKGSFDPILCDMAKMTRRSFVNLVAPAIA